MHRIIACLTHPWLPALAALLAALSVAPSLRVGFQADDFFHRAVLLAADRPEIAAALPDLPASELDLFTFADGDPARVRRMIEQGLFPWWTDPHLKLSFRRPLAAATHMLDYRFWPDSPALMHAQNILWFVVLVLAAGLLLRRMHGGTLCAGLAILIFALDDAHGFAVGWIANRNAIVAAALAVLSLLLHSIWRPGWDVLVAPSGAFTRWPTAAAAWACFAAALLAGETGLGIVGYLIGYALFIDRGRWPSRLASLIPYLFIAGEWAVRYRLGGHGAAGSDVYSDPLGDPPAFLGQLAVRIPVLIAAQFALPPAELITFLSDRAAAWMVACCAAVCVLLVVALRPLVLESRAARFWLCGVVLSLPLACATLPQDRLLIVVGLGAAGLIGQYIARHSPSGPANPGGRFRHGPASLLAGILLVIHTALAPALLPVRAYSPEFFSQTIENAAGQLAADEGVHGKHLVIVAAPNGYLTGLFRPILAERSAAGPASILTLYAGIHPAELTRIDERTIEVSGSRGLIPIPGRDVAGRATLPWHSSRFVHQRLNWLFASSRSPPPPGATIELPQATIEVIESDAEGRPLRARIRFPSPLDSSDRAWMTWRGGRLVPFDIPAIGKASALPGDLPY